MDGGIHVAYFSLEELFVRNRDNLDAFRGRDGDVVRVTLTVYLARICAHQ